MKKSSETSLIANETCTAPQMIPRPEMILKLDPNDSEPQMIPDVDRKWSRRKIRNGMEFVPRVVDSVFNINRSKSSMTIKLFYMDTLNSYDKYFFG